MSKLRLLERLILVPATRLPILFARIFDRVGWVKQYQPLLVKGSNKVENTDRNYGRLKAIKTHLPADASIGLDVGCNNGFFAFSIAATGKYVYGVEGSDSEFQLLLSQKRLLGMDRVIPVNLHVSPETIQLLPVCDFVICMAIFHHWVRDYGEDAALEILFTLLSKTNMTMFFEVPFARDSGGRYRDVLPDRHASDQEEWWRNWFSEHGWTRFEPIFEKGRTLYCVERDRQI